MPDLQDALLETLEGILPEFLAYVESEQDDEIKDRNLAWCQQAERLIARAKAVLSRSAV